MELILAHGGRITWDELLLISALAVPLVVLVGFVIARTLHGRGDEPE
ncbi:MAG: hypothetical protein ACRDJ5_04980 [Actinomycetota bacterium]